MEQIKIVVLGALAGTVLLVFLGFVLAGWVLGSTAQEMAQTAIVERLAPICVEQFKRDPARDRKLVGLKKAGSSEATANVENQGWATMPGSKKPDSQIAIKCAELIVLLD